MLTVVREWRLFTIGFVSFLCYLALTITKWIVGLPDVSNAQSAFGSAVVLACVGVVKFWTETSASSTTITNS